MASSWDEIRREFPGLEGKAYLNAAATSPIPRPVREAAERFYRQLEAEGAGPWNDWMDRCEGVRQRGARFVGAEPDQIAFVAITSSGINLILDLLARERP